MDIKENIDLYFFFSLSLFISLCLPFLLWTSKIKKGYPSEKMMMLQGNGIVYLSFLTLYLFVCFALLLILISYYFWRYLKINAIYIRRKENIMFLSHLIDIKCNFHFHLSLFHVFSSLCTVLPLKCRSLTTIINIKDTKYKQMRCSSLTLTFFFASLHLFGFEMCLNVSAYCL